LSRYVGAQRQGESAWRITWENRDKLPGKLAGWFRALAAEGREPAERVLLGRSVALTMKTALARAAGLARQTVSRAINRGVPGRGWGKAATPQFYRSTHNCE